MRYSLLILATAVAALACPARSLTPQQALARAKATPSADMRASVRRAAAKNVHLVYTLADGAKPSLYTFASPSGGWLMVSADDVAAPVLAYSTSGQFDVKDMPPGMLTMLQGYQDEIRRARRRMPADSVYPPGYGRPTRRDIAPLCATRWNQSAPYNDLCPQVDSVNCPTGCVATAMAQIMKYFNYPVVGKGNFYYKWNSDTLRINLAKDTLQWASMLNVYGDTSTYTPAQGRAVAALMRDCGYSLTMKYGKSSSSASTSKAATALVSHFLYDPSLRYIERANYDLIEWEDEIYQNLITYGPVQIRGANSKGGAHSFVCDGISNNCMFHINWGWGGKSDGYFLFSALEPAAQGIGGSTAGYDDGVAAIIGIATPHGGTAYSGIVNRQAMTAEYKASSDSLIIYGYWKNNGTTNFTGHIRIDAEDADGNLVKNLKNLKLTDFTTSKYYSKMPIATLSTRGLTDGTYYLRFYFDYGDAADKEPIRNLNNQSDYVLLIVNNGTYTPTVPLRYDTYVRSAKGCETLYLGNNYTFHPLVSTTTPTPEVVELTPAIYTRATPPVKVLSLTKLSGQVYNGDNIFDYDGKLAADALEAGDYYLAFEYIVGVQGSKDVTVLASPYIPITVAEDPGAYSELSGSFTIENADNVDPNAIRVTYTLTCPEGYFADYLRFRIYPTNSTTSLATLKTPYVYLHAGDSVKGTFMFKWPEAEPGTEYRARLQYIKVRGGNTITPVKTTTYQHFTTMSTTGITDLTTAQGCTLTPNPVRDTAEVMATAPIQSLRIYDLNGRVVKVPYSIDGDRAHLQLGSLPKGRYILRLVLEGSAVRIINVAKR